MDGRLPCHSRPPALGPPSRRVDAEPLPPLARRRPGGPWGPAPGVGGASQAPRVGACTHGPSRAAGTGSRTRGGRETRKARAAGEAGRVAARGSVPGRSLETPGLRRSGPRRRASGWFSSADRGTYPGREGPSAGPHGQPRRSHSHYHPQNPLPVQPAVRCYYH